MPPAICPTCGATVPPDARACPGCGSDDDTGWSEQAYAPNPDLPDEDFSYDDFVKREFEDKPAARSGLHWGWWILAAALAAACLLGWIL